MSETMMTREEREAARARCDAATAGPWRVGRVETWHVFGDCENRELIAYPLGRVILRLNDHYPHGADAAFIAHARTDLPRALDAIDALETERDELRALLRQAQEALTACSGELHLMGGEDGICPYLSCTDHAKDNAARISNRILEKVGVAP